MGRQARKPAAEQVPSSRDDFAEASWELYRAAKEAGDLPSAIRALRTTCELLGALGEANRRRRVDEVGAKLREELEALAKGAK